MVFQISFSLYHMSLKSASGMMIQIIMAFKDFGMDSWAEVDRLPPPVSTPRKWEKGICFCNWNLHTLFLEFPFSIPTNPLLLVRIIVIFRPHIFNAFLVGAFLGKSARHLQWLVFFLFSSSDYNLTLIGPLFLQAKLLKLLP